MGQLQSIVARKDFDLNGFYGEATHVFQVEERQDYYLLYDVFKQGQTVSIDKNDFVHTFVFIEEDDFRRYETAVYDGDSRLMEEAVRHLRKKYRI